MRGAVGFDAVATVVLLLAGATSSRGQAVCSPTSPPPGPCVVAVSQPLSQPIDATGRDLVITENVTLTTTTAALSIDAARLTLEKGARIVGAGSGGLGTDLDVTTAGAVQLKSGAAIVTTADTAGGAITIAAGGDVTIDGRLDSHAGHDGFGGSIDLSSAAGDVLLTGPVTGRGGSGGIGGDLTIVASAGDVTVGGPLDFSGGDGGSIDLDAAGVLSTTAGTGTMDVSASAPASDAGEITLHGAAAVRMAGTIVGRSVGNNVDGAGTAADVSLSSEGDVTIDGALDLTGASPDGQGGSLSARGAAITVAGPLLAAGRGPDGCGGEALFRATGPLALGQMDVSGASCGGGVVDATSEAGLSVPYEIDGDASNGGQGATMTLRALDVLVTSKLHANGIDGGGPGGVIMLHGCALTVGASGLVQTQGSNGTNLLRANGAMLVRGLVTAGGKTCTAGLDRGQPCETDARCTPPTPAATIPAPGLCAESGQNVIEYADPAIAPALAVAPTPAARPRLADLSPCVGPDSPSTTTTSSSSTSTSTTATSSSTSSTLVTSTSTTSTSSSTASFTTTASSTSSSSTSSTASTSSTSSSTTSTTASTSTSRSTSSTSTSTSTSTTTATVPTCSALACADDDPCTDDECVDGACAYVPVAGVRAVTCRLAIIESALQAAVPAEVGGSRTQAQLLARVDASRVAIETAGAPGTPRARRGYRRAVRHLQALIRAVRHGTKKGTVEAGLGDDILTTAESARSRLLPLQRS